MKNIRKPTFSAYKITWVEFRPTKGVATKHDCRLLAKRGKFTNGRATYSVSFEEWFPTREDALKHISCIDPNKLDKNYECRLFTDKQFGMRKESEKYKIHFTTKQEKNVIFITKL